MSPGLSICRTGPFPADHVSFLFFLMRQEKGNMGIWRAEAYRRGQRETW